MTTSPFLQRTAKALVFYLATLAILSLIRFVFFTVYKTPDINTADFLPAAWMGLRVDAKWFSTLVAPAWIFLCLSLWRPVFWKLAVGFGCFASAVTTIMAVVNFGFFDFYRTPISPIIFGLFQDDTAAVVKTLLVDWPISQYLFCLVVLIGFPLVLSRVCFAKPMAANKWTAAAIVLFGTVLIAGLIRGSFGTFPLRQQNYAVSTNAFINATVPGGMASLYEAWKGQKVLDLKGGPETALRALGFKDAQSAEDLLRSIRSETAAIPAPERKPNVVVAVMESMGRDSFELHSDKCNTLGSLADELPHAVYFRNGISVNSGTFPSLEGILFDSPLTPLTQSRYGQIPFSFSKAKDFKAAGYKTIFLTSGNESWRQIDTNFPRQGFDEIIGANAIKTKFPDAQTGTWGIGDAWMFKFAHQLLVEADKTNQPVFLVILSATNHPPHMVPDGAKTLPVDASGYPEYVTDDRIDLMTSMLETYQYASNALGDFVRSVRTGDLKRETLIAASGDHNARLRYAPEGWWHHANGVPILFWLPESMKSVTDATQKTSADRWVSHRDILPTLEAFALGKQPKTYEGRNVLSQTKFDLATAFAGFGKSGWAIGSWGAAALEGGSKIGCYRWNADQLVPTACEGELARMGNAARAQRALVDYAIRSELLKK